MLEFIREKIKGTIATVIVGFFCAAFALWGVESLFDRGGSKQSVATVNGKEITEPEVAQAISSLRQRYTQLLGGKVDANFLSDKMLRTPALESLISRKLLESHAADMKMAVGPVTVDREIVRDPLFAKDGKAFDPEYYKEKLRSFGITPSTYRNQLSQQLVLTQLQQGVSTTAFITSKQVDAIAGLSAQKRSFEYLQLPLQSLIDKADPAEELAERYYQEHKSEFMTEEKVSIEYLELSKQVLMKDVNLDEAEIRASYDKESANFKPSTERRAAHILVEVKPDGSEKKILETIGRRLKSGESFGGLAKEFSHDEGSASQGGDVGFTKGDTFVPEFEASLASLINIGDISEPVKTEFGYHIIKLLDKKETNLPSYEERKSELEKQLRQAKVDNIYTEKLSLFSESTYSAGDLTGPASEMGLDLQKTAAFGRRGGVGISGQQKVIDAAFSSELLDSGKNSHVIELSADKAVVIRVNSHELPKSRALSEVKEEIMVKLKREQSVNALKEKSQSLNARVQSGTALSVIAKEENLAAPTTLQNKTRDAAGEGITPELLAAAFKMAKPTDQAVVADIVELSNGDVALLKLTDVKDVQLDPNSAEYKAVKERMENAAGNVEFSWYEQELQKAAKIIRKDTKAINVQE
jgi:peptidyl-prolyl cis-trans isomerase D